jgi:hypothetical protein
VQPPEVRLVEGTGTQRQRLRPAEGRFIDDPESNQQRGETPRPPDLQSDGVGATDCPIQTDQDAP